AGDFGDDRFDVGVGGDRGEVGRIVGGAPLRVVECGLRMACGSAALLDDLGCVGGALVGGVALALEVGGGALGAVDAGPPPRERPAGPLPPLGVARAAQPGQLLGRGRAGGGDGVELLGGGLAVAVALADPPVRVLPAGGRFDDGEAGVCLGLRGTIG